MTDGEKMIYAAVYASHWVRITDEIRLGKTNSSLGAAALFAHEEAHTAVGLFREINMSRLSTYARGVDGVGGSEHDAVVSMRSAP